MIINNFNKEIIRLAANNNLLLSPEILEKITKEDINNILNLFKDKLLGDSTPLVVNKELLNLITKSDSKVSLNWSEYEKAKVDTERGNHNQIYSTFLEVLDSTVSTEKKIETYNNSFEQELDLDEKVELKSQNNVIVLKSYRCVGEKKEVKDFVRYYNVRYEALKSILMNRPDLSNAISINKLGYAKGKVSIIGLVLEKSTTKNGNLLITLEDTTGHISCIISKNKQNLAQISGDIVYDEVIGVVGDYSNNFLFIENIYFPDVPINNNLKVSEEEVYIAFISDIHVGSQKFLKQEFQTFIDWLNGKYGNKTQQEIAYKVKYLLIIGDTVAGVGVYPNQDEELEIKDIKEQYKELAKYLGEIRSDIKIVMCSGNHDASRVAEPQPPPIKDYAEDLYKIDNLLHELVRRKDRKRLQ